jgi:hypothetical protein
MADAVGAVDRRFLDYFLEVVQLSRSAADVHLAVLSDNGYPCRIITAIFQTPQSVEDERNDFFGADISDDSAHGLLSERSS